MQKYLDNILVCLNKFTLDTEEEIECIQKACEITDMAFEYIIPELNISKLPLHDFAK